MKVVKTVALVFEVLIIFLALLFPVAFVLHTAHFAAILPLVLGNPITYAYGVVVVCICAASSFVRALVLRPRPPRPQKRALLFSSITVLAAFMMIYALTKSSMQQATPEAITSPYFSYFLSIIFCMGVGYAVAELLSIFLSKE